VAESTCLVERGLGPLSDPRPKMGLLTKHIRYMRPLSQDQVSTLSSEYGDGNVLPRIINHSHHTPGQGPVAVHSVKLCRSIRLSFCIIFRVGEYYYVLTSGPLCLGIDGRIVSPSIPDVDVDHRAKTWEAALSKLQRQANLIIPPRTPCV
jgi:hypothetical protein